MIPSLEGWPTKAEEAPSPHEVRLALLDTNPVFQNLGEILPERPGWSAGDMVKQPENQKKIQQNEEHRQIKIHIKNEQQKKNLTGGSPKQSNIAGSF